MEQIKQGQQCCLRCNRKLSNPHSIAKNLGPVCYKKSGGGVFDGNLQADDKEWTRREKLLRSGGEIDLGVNWEYPDPGNMLPLRMRVSVRYKDGAYEAYGFVLDPGKHEESTKEVVFARDIDLKVVFREAIAAGPTATAQAHRARKQAFKAAKSAAKRAS